MAFAIDGLTTRSLFDGGTNIYAYRVCHNPQIQQWNSQGKANWPLHVDRGSFSEISSEKRDIHVCRTLLIRRSRVPCCWGRKGEIVDDEVMKMTAVDADIWYEDVEDAELYILLKYDAVRTLS